MAQERSDHVLTLALSTKLEEDFVSPLTAARGALEILRDYPDLEDQERQHFIATALRGCQQLEQAIGELADTVYAAGHCAPESPSASTDDTGTPNPYVDRITTHEDTAIMEVDFSELVFSNAQVVNDVHDAIEAAVQASGRKWFFLINYNQVSIWPEAWVAFAHRGKRIAVNFSMGTVRYSEGAGADSAANRDLYASRAAALAKIDEMKAARAR